MKMPILTSKRNTSSTILLKHYCDKKSGKVSAARKEIKCRFDYLDWIIQKRVMIAFLTSCKTDRMWAYGKLLKNWDDSFVPLINTLWTLYHEYKCSWSIIKYFPEDYILKNIESLSAEGNYFFICKRLGHNPDFVIDRNKLSSLEYLSVLYSVGRDIDKMDALYTLYKLIGNHCSVGLIMIDIVYPSSIIRNIGFNPMNIRDVRRALYYLKEMGCQETVRIFEGWCNDVAEKIRSSKEFKKLSSLPLSDDKFVERLSDIAVVEMYLSLPLSMMSKIKDTIK